VIAIAAGCAEKSPSSFEGDPFATECGRKTATQITISTLVTVKNGAWTTVADVIPETDEPGMLPRKMPIIAAVPAWAGATALIAVPPCEAPHDVLKDRLLFGYAARRMFRHVSLIRADSTVFRPSATRSQGIGTSPMRSRTPPTQSRRSLSTLARIIAAWRSRPSPPS
jgi:hypothetical protein